MYFVSFLFDFSFVYFDEICVFIGVFEDFRRDICVSFWRGLTWGVYKSLRIRKNIHHITPISLPLYLPLYYFSLYHPIYSLYLFLIGK